MKPARCDTMLRAMIFDAQELIDRHCEVLDRELDDELDHEVADLRDTIKESQEALAAQTAK